ncbi:MAG: TatD family hydrolase [Spirochaetaceae bacterium]|nr:TatD family hydrolase [Spirochaetaceae bacterium]
MASCAHCHPYDLQKIKQDAETERKAKNIACAASAHNAQGWNYNKSILETPTALCFAVHPQMPALETAGANVTVKSSLELLQELTYKKEPDAIGETGFDLFNSDYKETEKVQTMLFEEHLRLAILYDLPVVLHIRRAMQKVFLYSAQLKKIPAVVFHSFSGTAEDAQSLLRRGINAYFSFGTAILLNHKNAQEACSKTPLDRILFETDAPYQPLRGKDFSDYMTLYDVLQAAALIRSGIKSTTKEELERASDLNFFTVYKKGLQNG